MTARINIRELREAARQGDYFLNAEMMLALLDAASAARHLYEAVEMDESVGVCLTDRVPSLQLGVALARFDFGDDRAL